MISLYQSVKVKSTLKNKNLSQNSSVFFVEIHNFSF
nr:MAG TPA: hypothetical protein [Caudoviricetes sp.]DAL15171.1 MAG TPA_asm: hypothetical protein [Caudoviricetes sp.]DAL64100.1 MAG TPA_asm: hypothetical protein [Caudoviricetes sp.]DAO64410.1 MAG TPA: hypothetical protein [Caudoviricetes sp.]DAV64526.1 MAG TPA: hypothetical protein [Caudoviricetes sp.]